MTVAFIRAGYATSPSTGRKDSAKGYEKEPVKESNKKMVDEKGDLMELDLLSKIGSWPLRNQLAIPACTAYAAMACVELYLAVKTSEKTGEKKEPTPLSAAEAYYKMREHVTKVVDTQPVRAASPGFTRFMDVIDFLNDGLYHKESDWRDRLTEAEPEQPGRGEKEEVKVCYHSYPPPNDAKSWPPLGIGRPERSIALAIYKELLNDRPVGAGFPAYARPEGHGMTNWTSAFENGIVRIPRDGDALDMEAGHAVCIVGFADRGEKIRPKDISQIAASDIRKGYFVFRNSFGEMFACAPTTDLPQGYGLVSADLVEKCCWEVMFMRPAFQSDPLGEEARETAVKAGASVSSPEARVAAE